jgi:type II secretory pathway pseudopilin PulG
MNTAALTTIMPGRLGGAGRHFRSPGAFSLSEMLVVIAVIVILVSVLVPMVSRARQKAAITAQRLDFITIATALEAYKADCRDYPRNSAFNDSTLSPAPTSIGPLAAGLIGPGPAVLTSGHLGDGCDGPGFRIYWNPATSTGGKVYPAYLQSERFTIIWTTSPPGSSFPPGSQYPELADHWGNPIQYFTQFNTVVTMNSGTSRNKLLGQAYNHGGLPPVPGDVFDVRDSDGYGYSNGNLPPTVPPLPLRNIIGDNTTGTGKALLYMLGDDSTAPGLGQDNYIESGATPPESLRNFGPYVLVSAGPDGLFTDLSNLPAGESVATFMSKADDVYNFDR